MLGTERADADPAALASGRQYGVLRTLLIADDPALQDMVLTAIALAGHEVAGHAATTHESRALAADQKADVALIVLPLPGIAEVLLCSELHAGLRLPIVLMVEQIHPALIERCAAAGVHGCVSRATSPAILSATLVLATRQHQAHVQLEAERDRLAEQTRQLLGTLENRKLIERAKGIYMRVLGLQESDAHKRLQQESQRRRLPIADLARKIIESDELLGPGY